MSSVHLPHSYESKLPCTISKKRGLCTVNVDNVRNSILTVKIGARICFYKETTLCLSIDESLLEVDDDLDRFFFFFLFLSFDRDLSRFSFFPIFLKRKQNFLQRTF